MTQADQWIVCTWSLFKSDSRFYCYGQSLTFLHTFTSHDGVPKGGLWMFTLQYEYLIHVWGLGKIHKIQKVSHLRERSVLQNLWRKKQLRVSILISTAVDCRLRKLYLQSQSRISTFRILKSPPWNRSLLFVTMVLD